MTEKQLIYPNPTRGVITLPAGVTSGNIELYNSVGQKIYFNKTNESIIDLSGNLPGMYFLIIKGNSNDTNYKIILQ